MRLSKKTLLKALAITSLVVLSVLLLQLYQFNQFSQQPMSLYATDVQVDPQTENEKTQNNPLSSKIIHIHPGSSAYRVAYLLKDELGLSHPRWFVWYLRWQGLHAKLKAGEMRIQPDWTLAELVDALVKGETVKYPATFIAGHTLKQSLEMLKGLPKLKQTITDLKSLKNELNIPHSGQEGYRFSALEGWLLPETYYYEAGDTDLAVLKRAKAAMQNTLDKAWQSRQASLPLKTPYEALIMASIVEKETGYAPERRMIAGVFIQRLRKKMRLQTDPTVIYGIGETYDGDIRFKDLKTKTPYNTYKINGLPPTPIALPSADAIQAVLNPDVTNALYFVAKGGGQHHFSETLQEHNRAVRRYLLNK